MINKVFPVAGRPDGSYQHEPGRIQVKPGMSFRLDQQITFFSMHIQIVWSDRFDQGHRSHRLVSVWLGISIAEEGSLALERTGYRKCMGGGYTSREFPLKGMQLLMEVHVYVFKVAPDPGKTSVF